MILTGQVTMLGKGPVPLAQPQGGPVRPSLGEGSQSGSSLKFLPLKLPRLSLDIAIKNVLATLLPQHTPLFACTGTLVGVTTLSLWS